MQFDMVINNAIRGPLGGHSFVPSRSVSVDSG